MVRKINEKKRDYVNRLAGAFKEYNKILIVTADNVGSKQLQQIRTTLRGQALIVMGKNSLIKKALSQALAAKPSLAVLKELIVGNIGLVFTKGDVKDVRDVIASNKVGAPAKAGAISSVNVVVPAINTGMEPTKTSFFQALNIPTKITRGTVEIISEVTLLKVGDKVGNSEATLLQMLGITPFSYGLKVTHVFEDGDIYDPAVLDISQDDLAKKFQAGIANVAAISLAINYPTQASIPHVIINSFKNLLAIALETDVPLPQADSIKAYLADPSAFAVAAAPVAAATTTAAAAPEPESESEEEEGDFGFSLFD